MKIRPVKDKDIAQITDIYNGYILNTTVTFELAAISALEMQQRVRAKTEKYDWLVGEVNQTIIGYAYYGAFHARAAYSHTVETTIYLAQAYRRKGHGESLYRELMRSARERGFRELIGVIALPNPGSIALHQKLGFEEVGILKKVGYKFEQYLDVTIWQKSLF